MFRVGVPGSHPLTKAVAGATIAAPVLVSSASAASGSADAAAGPKPRLDGAPLGRELHGPRRPTARIQPSGIRRERRHDGKDAARQSPSSAVARFRSSTAQPWMTSGTSPQRKAMPAASINVLAMRNSESRVGVLVLPDVWFERNGWAGTVLVAASGARWRLGGTARCCIRSSSCMNSSGWKPTSRAAARTKST